MKLLSPSQTKDLRGEELARQVIRTQETEEAAKRANISLAKAEADFAATLVRHREEWAREEESHRERKREMDREIEELEAKKLNEIIPLGILQGGTDDRFREAEKFLADLKAREEHTLDLTERLEDKLDQVGAMQEDAKKKAQALSFREQGIVRQENLTTEGAKLLTDRMQQFEEKRLLGEKDIADRKTAVFLEERSLAARKDTLDRTEKSLKALDIQLKDQRETLARAWAELRRKDKNIQVENTP